jgi:hypothetical protein
MSPETNLILNEMQKQFAEQNVKLDKRFAESEANWEKRFLDLEHRGDERIAKVEKVAIDLEDWKPEIEGKVDDIKLEVGKFTKHWERSIRESAMSHPGVIPQLGSAAARPSAGDPADRPSGHGLNSSYREVGCGFVTTYHPPVKGASNPPLPLPYTPSPGSRSGLGTERLPKVNFPEFDGENPKLWLARSEDYFEMYNVESHRWIKFATMRFTKAVARWLQSVDLRLRRANWDEFARMLLDRFGREHQELMLRQLFNIKQLGSVSEYVEQFSGPVDQSTSYGHSTDPLYFTMCFIDGLKFDIKTVVLVQHPKDLDTAYSLALLQEDVSTTSPYITRKHDPGPFQKFTPRAPLPLPPPPRIDKHLTPVLPEEKRLCEGKSLEENGLL